MSDFIINLNDLAEIRAKISGVRSQVEELEAATRKIWGNTSDRILATGAYDLAEALADAASDLADLEGDVE